MTTSWVAPRARSASRKRKTSETSQRCAVGSSPESAKFARAQASGPAARSTLVICGRPRARGRYRQSARVGERVEHALAAHEAGQPRAVLAHVGEEADVDAAAQVHLVGDAAFADDQLVGRRLADDVVLRPLGRVARPLEPRLEDRPVERQPGGGEHLERALGQESRVPQQPARESRDDGERTVDVGAEAREAVPLAVGQAVRRFPVGEAERPAKRQGRGQLAAQERRVRRAAVVAVRPDAHELVLRIGDPGRARPPARIDETHRPSGLDRGRLNVGERELRRPRDEPLLAGGREVQAEERHGPIIENSIRFPA